MHVQRRHLIRATPRALWRCLTELDLQKKWISQLVDETPDGGPHTGVGARSTMRMKEGNKTVSYACVVTAWEPERRLAIRLTEGSFAPGMAMDVVYGLSAADGGTWLDYDVRVPMVGLKFKLLMPLIWLVSLGNVKKDMAKLAALAPAMVE